MTVSNGYASLADVKAALRITDAIDDNLIELSIEAASREIDGYCDRVFYSTTATRVYFPESPTVVETDDIVSVTTLKTLGTDDTFSVTWGAADYQLEPLNGVVGGLTQPYTRVRAIDDLLFDDLTTTASVQVVGVFGWASVPTAIRQACTLLAMRQFKRYDSPTGVMGFGDMGVVRVGRVDPDIEALLAPFKKVAYA